MSVPANTRTTRTARDVAETVVDPELPMLTLADLGVLRSVEETPDEVVVTLTPTYVGCPALVEMRADVVRALGAAGFGAVRVDVRLDPPWSTDDLTDHARATLRAHGISPPGPRAHQKGPVPLTLSPVRRCLDCPRCGSAAVELTSEFGPTPCTALYRCTDCREPFQHVKER